ncbi:MAG TPA: RluA family pseudouridine synthase [Nitrospirae bacterium]|nr:RluA family pseudouridine synthase [Nitrospirota bacterium]
MDRADLFISARCGITRSQAGKLIKEGAVSVDGRTVKASSSLHEGQEVAVNMPETSPVGLEPEDIGLDVLHSDEHLVVVNKPPGLVVYPAAGHSSGTMMNALKARFGTLASIGGPLRPGVVHRLDKDTSGAIVVALTDKAYYILVEQFKERSTQRSYITLVNGRMREGQGEIDTPIGRSPHDRKKMSTKSPGGKEALTHWKTLKEFSGASLLEVRLSTGRTHQIRVHMISIGHSVLGDRAYGRKTRVEYKSKVVKFPRQMLHAATLGFNHPETGQRMDFEAPMPEDMLNAIKSLEALS